MRALTRAIMVASLRRGRRVKRNWRYRAGVGISINPLTKWSIDLRDEVGRSRFQDRVHAHRGQAQTRKPTVSVRKRLEGDLGAMSVEELIAKLVTETQL